MDSKEEPKPGNVNGEPSKPEVSEIWNPPFGVLMLKLTFDAKRSLSKTELCFVVSERPKIDEGKRSFNLFRVACADWIRKGDCFVDSRDFPDGMLNKGLVGRIPFGSHYEYKLPVNDNDLYTFVKYLPYHLRSQLRLNISEGKVPSLKVLTASEKVRLISTINKVEEDNQQSRNSAWNKPTQRRF